jgi:hypothetical protein
MTRATLLRLGGADGCSCLTVLGVDADNRDADLTDPEDADPVETDAIHRGIQELPQQGDNTGRCGSGISRTGEFPRLMCVRTASGEGPSYAASLRSYLHRKNTFHAWRLSR